MLKRLIPVASVLLVVVLLAGCGGGGASTGSNAGNSSNNSSGGGGSAPTAASADVKRFEVSLTEFAFSPNALEVNKGDQVEVVITNDGVLAHDFRIDALNVNSGLVQPGETKTITFTADRAGEFEIYCHEAGHKPSGMTGTLTVIG